MARKYTPDAWDTWTEANCFGVTYPPMSMFGWVKLSSYVTGCILQIVDPVHQVVFASILIRDTKKASLFIHDHGGAQVGDLRATADLSLDTWHSIGASFSYDGSWDASLYVDYGTGKATDEKVTITNVSAGTLGQYTTIAAAGFRDASPGGYINAALAELAVWGVALDDAAQADLGAAHRPSIVQPGDLKFYAPMISDKTLSVGGADSIATSGTITTVSHPEMYVAPVGGGESLQSRRLSRSSLKIAIGPRKKYRMY